MIDIEDKNIVLVVADTLTALHLPSYGYDRDTAPFLTKLAEDNLLLKNAYSNAPWTAPSHASMFSGKLPSDHGTSTNSVIYKENSFVQELQQSGYNTIGISANNLISKDLNFDKGFNEFYEVFDFDTESSEDFFRAASKAAKNPDLQTIKKGFKFLKNKIFRNSSRGAENIEDIVKQQKMKENQPNFLFINYTETHLPYNAPEDYVKLFTDNSTSKISRHMKDHLNSSKPEIFYQGFPNSTDQELIDLYDASIRYLDQKLESLYKYLNEELDDLVFIVTSDHGENFGKHGAYFHQCGIWEKSIRIPFIIAGDEVPNEEIKENFSWRKTNQLILNGKIETSEAVFAEYEGWEQMTGTGIADSREDLKTKFASNKSRAVIKNQRALVENSHIDNFQFVPGEKCYSEQEEYFDQEDLETKLEIILGPKKNSKS